jgi:hypothetical protein
VYPNSSRYCSEYLKRLYPLRISIEKTYIANKRIAGTKGVKTALIAPLVSLPVERSNNAKKAVTPVPPI